MFPWPETFSTTSNFFAPTQSAEEGKRKRKSQHYRPTQGLKLSYGGSNFKGGSIRCGCSLISVKNLLVPGF
jgi:hypothetical protein